MPWRSLEATVYVEKPTEIEYKGGMFIVTDHYSDTCMFRRCYTPHTFLASLRAANQALAKWQFENRDVVPVAIGRKSA